MGIGTVQSEHWEFLLIFGILGAHCLAGTWISTSCPQRIYYNERWVPLFCSSLDDISLLQEGRLHYDHKLSAALEV